MKTVKDLREALKDLPDDMPVVIGGEDEWTAECDDTMMIPDGKGGHTPGVVLYIEV